MSFTLKHRRFAPSPFAIVLTLAGVALFLRLGFWQLDRADEKQALLDQAAAGEQSTVEASLGSVDALPRYQRVSLRGRYDSTRQVLLDNMYSSLGRPGYRVLTPFALESGGWVLVDRGWLAPVATRQDLPDVAVAEEVRTISGALDELRRPGMRMGESEALGEGWPRPLHFPTQAQLERVLERTLARRVVLLDPQLPDGYERSARVLAHVDPGRHIGYAVQWFAFALVALAIFVVIALKKTASHEHP